MATKWPGPRGWCRLQLSPKSGMLPRHILMLTHVWSDYVGLTVASYIPPCRGGGRRAAIGFLRHSRMCRDRGVLQRRGKKISGACEQGPGPITVYLQSRRTRASNAPKRALGKAGLSVLPFRLQTILSIFVPPGPRANLSLYQ